MFKWLRRKVCIHAFSVNDMYETDFKEPEPPKDRTDYDAWVRYNNAIYNCDANKKRIAVPCSKCGYIKYSWCGLNIVNVWDWKTPAKGMSNE